MCVKLPLGDLNPNHCPPHPTITYTYGVTVALKVCGDNLKKNINMSVWIKRYKRNILCQ